MSASRVAAAAIAGGPETPSSASAAVPPAEDVRPASDVGLKGGGGGNDIIACNAVIRELRGASPGGSKAR